MIWLILAALALMIIAAPIWLFAKLIAAIVAATMGR
jgi:hypothetical protein